MAAVAALPRRHATTRAIQRLNPATVKRCDGGYSAPGRDAARYDDRSRADAQSGRNADIMISIV